MKIEFHLTLKNGMSWIVGGCVLALAIIPLKVPPEHLIWWRWQLSVIFSGVAAIIALFIQVGLQSKEDHDAREQNKQIQATLTGLKELIEKPHPSIPTPLNLPPTTAVHDPDIDGELYRAVTSPKLAVPYKMLKEIYQIKGVQEEPTIDVDVLIEMNAVNRSPHSIYIKEFDLIYGMDGQTHTAKPEKDFYLDLMDKKFEYCINDTDRDDTERALSNLMNVLHSELKPRQPIDGWLRFSLHENPEKIHSSSTNFSVEIVDSLGNRHVITKASSIKRAGQIELRRAKS